MTNYYVNTQMGTKGEHEVHTLACVHGAFPQHRKPLGAHPNCQSAVLEAKKTYPSADGCWYCCNECSSK
jgi:hypothetical protein